ncbi:MAG: hypothetical protein KAG53_07300 [Endozoicomonadaceae bacterium]|nr:hypothetical protein [Endozoicomonadaceae bacterium]
MSDEDKELFHDILLNSGNLELQECHVGIQGYKLRGIKSIEQRIGDNGVLREVIREF